jgi:hypothetical protein
MIAPDADKGTFSRVSGATLKLEGLSPWSLIRVALNGVGVTLVRHSKL